jgi:hypothetical protein
MEVDGPQFAAVVPVVTLNGARGAPEVIGSGVVTTIAGDGQLLTAAHVLDKADADVLLIPGPPGFVAFPNAIFCSEAPGGDRDRDELDIGYVRLGTATGMAIDPGVTPVDHAEMAMSRPQGDGPTVYTFVGFPWRKSKTRGGDIFSEQVRITGTGLDDLELTWRGYDPDKHIAIRYNRKKMTYGSINRAIGPKPEGMSGGGIFAWPKPLRGLSSIPTDLRLAGIIHSYDQKAALLIGTRIEYLVVAIVRKAISDERTT